ncbi:hypothetical protein BB558_003639 [Smittium angustum]|uniref:Endonuclease/exonuclease/phosphatase domain-containing protein n=1 Tax=Smittium angustum TaxID=133377 RepID=A0A2U1J5M1_SMIAN|nr:hypothetical protein BB558_003639 [Smittium angustum]
MDAIGTEIDSTGNNVGNTNTGAGRSDKLIIWNAPELKAKTISDAILMHTQLNQKDRKNLENVLKVIIRTDKYKNERKERLKTAPKMVSDTDDLLVMTINKEGTGLLIGVKSNSGLNITELKNSTQWMASKVYGAFVNGKKFEIIVINVHLPQKKHAKYKDIQMIVLGDFNSNIKQTVSYVNLADICLSRIPVTNLTRSRVLRGKIGRMVDHIYHRGFQQHPDSGKVQKYLYVMTVFYLE